MPNIENAKNMLWFCTIELARDEGKERGEKWEKRGENKEEKKRMGVRKEEEGDRRDSQDLRCLRQLQTTQKAVAGEHAQ